MTPEQMMAAMAKKGQMENAAPTRTNAVSWEEHALLAKHWIDVRQVPRFWFDGKQPVGQYKGGRPVYSQVSPIGIDPFAKWIHQSKEKNKKASLHEAAEALYAHPIYNPNFHPLNEILTHPFWKGEDKCNVLRTCLSYEMDVNQVDPNTKGFALNAAFSIPEREWRNRCIILLVERGADVNKPDKDGASSIHRAIQNGSPELIPFLLSRGAKSAYLANGSTLNDLAKNRFLQQSKIAGSIERFEASMTDYYATLAYLKKYGLGVDIDMKDVQATMEASCSKYPQYLPYIQRMTTKLQGIKSEKVPERFTKNRLLTNPGNGYLNELTGNEGEPQSALGSFFSKYNLTERLERKVFLQETQRHVTSLIGDLSQFENKKVLPYLQGKRKELDLDYVVDDRKNNPHLDTILTKSIREGRLNILGDLITLNVNLHAKDKYGNTAMHLLAQTCNDKEAFLVAIKQMIGVPSSDGESRVSLLGNNNLADWNLSDGKGRTFLQIVAERNPEWIPDLEKQLGLKYADYSIPWWTPEKMPLLTNADGEELLHAKVEPTVQDLQVLKGVNPLASMQDKEAHVRQFCDVVENCLSLKNTIDTNDQKTIQDVLNETIQSQDVHTKMRAMLYYAEDMDGMGVNKVQAQTTIMRSISDTMTTGTDIDRRQIFEAFDTASRESQQNLVYMLESQSVLMTGNIENVTEKEKSEIQITIQELQQLTSQFTERMSNYAEQYYGQDNLNIDQNDITTNKRNGL